MRARTCGVVTNDEDDPHAVLACVTSRSSRSWDSNVSTTVRVFEMAEAATTGTTPGVDRDGQDRSVTTDTCIEDARKACRGRRSYRKVSSHYGGGSMQGNGLGTWA